MQTESQPLFLDVSEKILLRIESDALEYRFLAGRDENHLQMAGSGRTQLLSTECMPMTFTGCYVGVFAEKTDAWFEQFQCCRHRGHGK